MYKLYLLSLLSLISVKYACSQANAGEDLVIYNDKRLDNGADPVIGPPNPDNTACYSWDPVEGLSDPHAANPSARPTKETTYSLTVTGDNFSSQSVDQVIVYILDSIHIVPAGSIFGIYCDGTEVRMDIQPFPEDLPLDKLSRLKDIVLTSMAVEHSFGNIIGTTTLKFSALDDELSGTIENMIWYATTANTCNFLSGYDITASLTINGKELKDGIALYAARTSFPGPPDVPFKICGGGQAFITSPFSGVPIFNTVQLGNGQWETTVEQGEFQRKIETSIEITIPEHSQFFDQAKAEEEYHVGQFKGTNGNYYQDLWDPQRVMQDVVSHGPYIDADEEQSTALAAEAVLAAVERENFRSEVVNNSPSFYCKVEREAKDAVQWKFGYTLECAFPDCP